MDLVNQNCGENLTEPLIDFDINDGSNQRIVMTGDETKESCHIVSLFMQYWEFSKNRNTRFWVCLF